MARLRRYGPLLVAHAVGLLPGLALAYAVLAGRLEPDPIRAAVLRTGRLAMFMLTLSLVPGAVLRLMAWTSRAPRRWGWLLRMRGVLGLYAFGYAAVHLALQAAVDYGLQLRIYAEAVLAKRYGLAGLASFLLLLPLAVTSTRGWMRRLGPWWRRLHWLVYPGAAAAVVHYLWTVKADRTPAYVYAAVLGLLLFMRVIPGKRVSS